MRRAYVAVGLIAILLLTSGCPNADQSKKLNATQWAVEAAPDLNCWVGGAAVRKDYLQTYDIDRAGPDEIFVDLYCANEVGLGDQLEVFRGPSRLSRIARITSVSAPPNEQMSLEHGCISFRNNKVVIIGQLLHSTNPNAFVSLTSTWNSKTHRLDVGQPTPMPTTAVLPPGCP